MNKNILKIVKFLAIMGVWTALIALAGFMKEFTLIIILFAIVMIMLFAIGALVIVLMNLQER